MKLLSTKYTYILITVSLLLSTGLQAVWLQQLFAVQQQRLKTDIENLVSKLAQTNIYYSITSLDRPGNLQHIKQLFLSSQWQQLYQAFEYMKMPGLNSTAVIDVNDDSTTVKMSFSLKDKQPLKKKAAPVTTDTGLTPQQLQSRDSLSLINIRARVTNELRKMGIQSAIYHNLYTYNGTEIITNNIPKEVKPAFSSSIYKYSIQSKYRYQVNIASINATVWYQMRYYLASSILMIVLTCGAFYFILRSMYNQKKYATAKAVFTSNMTHEFKTPIATIAVALESIAKYNLINHPETLKNYLDISKHELLRIDQMVEKVLNLSDENNTEPILNFALYDVQSSLKQVATAMQLQLSNNQAYIALQAFNEPCFVNGDPFHLSNIFYNLIDNSIKYSKQQLTIEISCICDHEKVTLNFKDNGIGINKTYHRNIFERFFRVPNVGEIHDVKGTGLGLHYVKQIVQRHGGTIKVKSELNEGATFTIILPTAS